MMETEASQWPQGSGLGATWWMRDNDINHHTHQREGLQEEGDGSGGHAEFQVSGWPGRRVAREAVGNTVPGPQDGSLDRGPASGSHQPGGESGSPTESE